MRTATAENVAYPSSAVTGDLLMLMIAFSDNTAAVKLPNRLVAEWNDFYLDWSEGLF